MDGIDAMVWREYADVMEAGEHRHWATAMRDAAREVSRLRNLLQDGSPVVEGTIRHMAMEIAALKKERDELRDALYTLAKLGADKTGEVE